MTGPTPTHSDQNPVSGMAVTPNPAEERTEALSPARWAAEWLWEYMSIRDFSSRPDVHKELTHIAHELEYIADNEIEETA